MTTRSVLLVLAACLFGLFLPSAGVADDKPKTEKPKPALKVGDELPGVVEDFFAGPYHGHCGCPAVMIKNTQARAVVIWSRTADDTVLQFAKAADDRVVDGKKAQGYLVLFDDSAGGFRDKLDKSSFKGLIAGKARHSSAELFKRSGIDPKTAYVVFLVDNKEVKALWMLQAAELTTEKSRAILKEAATVLGREPPAKK